MRKCKQDFMGNTIILDENKLYKYICKESHTTVQITVFPNGEEAHKEFNRLTESYRGCGKKVKRHQTPIAKVYYNQLIIQL